MERDRPAFREQADLSCWALGPPESQTGSSERSGRQQVTGPGRAGDQAYFATY